MIFEHKSVLLMETVDSLNVKPDGIYVDGTLGGGGHAYEVSRRLGEKGRLIGIDQDADAIAAATERLLPREFAKLEKDVVLVGVGSRIEIWNKAVWNEKNVYDDMEEIAENMEGLGI